MKDSEDPQKVLERQRKEHPPRDPESVDDEGVAKLIKNIGLDGDAPTG